MLNLMPPASMTPRPSSRKVGLKATVRGAPVSVSKSASTRSRRQWDRMLRVYRHGHPSVGIFGGIAAIRKVPG